MFRCPPGSALWREVNDNIGDRPHVVFPGTVVGLVRRGTRLVVTPNDVVFYRPFETYGRSLRDARGDVSLFVAPAPELLDVPRAPVGGVPSAWATSIATTGRTCSPRPRPATPST